MAEEPSFQWWDELTPAEALDAALAEYVDDHLESARDELVRRGTPPDLAEGLAGLFFDTHGDLLSDEVHRSYAKLDFSAVPKLDASDPMKDGEPTPSKYMIRLVEARFAQQFLHKVLQGSFQRFANLATLVRPDSASNWTMEFFRRVGRCYVYGMDAECVILCRSILDAEFKNQISNDDCIKILGDKQNLRFELSDRIAVARALGRIDDNANDDASAVRNLANRTLHVHPGEAKRCCAFDAIAKTLSILRSLHGPHEDDERDDDGDSIPQAG
ncbi:MAG TPA: hypothetical protein VH518_24095 [Tepidisphaeraceae bacterium]